MSSGSVRQGVLPLGGQWREIPPLGGHVIYLNAERLGPRKFHDRSEVFARHGNLGTRGEFAWNYLYTRQNEAMASTDPRCPEPVRRAAVARYSRPLAAGNHTWRTVST